MAVTFLHIKRSAGHQGRDPYKSQMERFDRKDFFLRNSPSSANARKAPPLPPKRDTHARAHFSGHLRIIERKTQLEFYFWTREEAQWLRALTENLNSVPGTQDRWLIVTSYSSSFFWLPQSVLYTCKYPYTNTLIYIIKNKSK